MKNDANHAFGGDDYLELFDPINRIPRPWLLWESLFEPGAAEVRSTIGIFLKTFGDEMSEAQLPSLELASALQTELDAVAEMTGLDKAALEIGVTLKWIKGTEPGKGHWLTSLYYTGQPPESKLEVAVLEFGEDIGR